MMNNNILDKIISNKRKEVALQKEAVSLKNLIEIIEVGVFPEISFKRALGQSDSGIIAEFKRKSPSKGWIYEHADVARITVSYEQSGASAISVLTDSDFFGGGFEDLKNARASVGIPLLRKDFIIDEYQLFQAKALGANVILLIASALTIAESKYLSGIAKILGLEVLLEIHNDAELDYIQPNIDVVGINNRDLTSFVTDVNCSFQLGEKIPSEYLKISESGISDPKTVRELRKEGFKGFLIGETFMKTQDPGMALHEFVKSIIRD